MVRPRVRYAAISFLIATAPIVLMALASQTPERDGFVEPLRNVLVFGAAQWYPWAILAPFIDRQVRRWRPEASRPHQVAAHVGLLALFVVAHALVLNAATSIVAPEERRSLGRMITGEIVPDVILYSVLAAGFGIAESRRRQTEVAERLRAEVAEARLDALRQQLNPHFLFNTLNHIAAELRSGEVKPALRMLLSLADLLRDVLRERAQLIPLRDEVRMLERYLEIERERFGDRLQVEVTLEPRALDALVPCLLLQPLVENAVRHGISAADGNCRLTVTVRALGDGRSHSREVPDRFRDRTSMFRRPPARRLPQGSVIVPASRRSQRSGAGTRYTDLENAPGGPNRGQEGSIPPDGPPEGSEKRPERLTIEVRDAGPGLAGDATPARTGVGLSNTEQRLKYLFGDDYSFELRPVASGGLVVSIELPFRRS